MHRIQHTLIAALLCGCSLAIANPASASQPDAPLSTIAALDLPRYMGTWYEIARYPNWFQKKCAGFTRADYSLKPDGRVQVINRCRLQNGETDIALGTGRQIGDATSPRLEVRFAPAWLSFIGRVGRLLGHRPRRGLPTGCGERAPARVAVDTVENATGRTAGL